MQRCIEIIISFSIVCQILTIFFSYLYIYDIYIDVVGARATLRNAGLAGLLASVMVYPDHIQNYLTKPSKE